MVNLEKTLAEVQVLAEKLELDSQVQGPYNNYILSLRGIASSAFSSMRHFRLAKKFAEKKQINIAEKHYAEFAIDLKNLADNINIYLQVLYLPTPTKHPKHHSRKLYGSLDLTKLPQTAPICPSTENGESLLELFNKVHNHSKETPLSILRNIGGHYRGYPVLDRTRKTPSEITFNFSKINDEMPIDALAWLEGTAADYLGLAKTVLETSSELRSTSHQVLMRITKNWIDRHRGTMGSILVGAGLTAGVLGTLFAQNIQEKNRREYESGIISGLFNSALTEKQMRQEYGGYMPYINVTETRFNQIRDQLITNSANLGKGVDTYLSRVPIDSFKTGTEIRKFLKLREDYTNLLINLRYSPDNSLSALESFKNLQDALRMEGEVRKMESSIVSFFPRTR